MERVSDELHGVEVDGFQGLSAVAHKSRSAVSDAQPQDEVHVERGAIAQDESVQGPVGHAAAFDVARAHRHARTTLVACGAQAQQIFGVVREIAIHLEDEPVVACQGPLEPCDVGCAEPELAFPFEQVNALGVLGLGFLDQRRGAIGRSVVHHEDVEGERQTHDGVQHPHDVFLFVVRRNDDQAWVHVVILSRFNSSSVR